MKTAGCDGFTARLGSNPVRCGVKSDVAPRVMQNLTLNQKMLALRVYLKPVSLEVKRIHERRIEETETAYGIKDRNKKEQRCYGDNHRM